jgi:hypothetical protein
LAYGHRGNDLRAGIFVAHSTATAVANQLGVQDSQVKGSDLCGISGYSESADWGGYDGYVNSINVLSDIALMWFKLVYDATTQTLAAYYSANGCAWTLHTTRSSVAQPDRIGLAMWSNSGSIYADQQMLVDWFRVTEP